ncbi:MAG TPA: DUF2452 domain-containing protein [Lacibacter sp.]|nr:DUF2452 domain-containing protein [Lacibacter sp.]HMO89179.1 DUF2452 domain-containing protein [Lacibacter sp.]
MVQAYNFLAAWQLFPEKCSYEQGHTPKSGHCTIESIRNGTALRISTNWVTQLNEAFYTSFACVPDEGLHEFENKEVAQFIRTVIPDSSNLVVELLVNGQVKLTATHSILPNGYLRVTQEGFTDTGKRFTNVEVYHKQMSVLPYASSISGVAIRPTKEGVIRHQALTAMEEQTNMQLDQIRQQIELLARQAQEIVKRKELSLMIYEAKLNFRPVIGHVYHLYQKQDDSYILSMVSPKEWGGNGPFRQFVASARLLADHTWLEI